MAEKVELIDLTINVGDATADTRALKIQLEELKIQAERAKEEQGELSDEFIEYTAAIKQTQKELRSQQKLTQDVIAANNAQTGSIEQLRKQLAVVSVQWARLSKEERENTEEGKALAAQKLRLTEALKSEERATGDARRNVGNYAEALNELSPATSGVVQNIRNMTKAALAFIATPLGAILAGLVGVFKLLQGAFNRSITSQEKVNKVTARLGLAFGKLLDILEPIVDFILDKLIGAFDLLDVAIEGTIMLLEDLGVISEETAKELKEDFLETEKAAERLATAERRLVESTIALEKAQLRFQTQAEKLRQLRDDESRSIEERIQSNKELGELLKTQARQELALAQQAVQIAKDRELLNGRSIESIREIGDAEIKLLEIRERITSQESEQLMNLNSLRKEIRDKQLEEEKAAADAETEIFEDQLNEETELLKQQQEEINEIDKQALEERDRQKQQDAERRQLELDAELAAAQDNIFRTLELEREGLEQKRQQEIQFAESIGADTTLIEAKYARARQAINEAEQKAKIELFQGAAGAIALIAGEGTAVAKAAGVAETTITTWVAAQKAYASQIIPGDPSSIFRAVIAASSAVATGLANVKNILKVDSGLPGGKSVAGGSVQGGTGGGTAPTQPSLINPTLNQGIISREAIQNATDANVNVQPTLVIDDVTSKQVNESENQTTAVI
jgi:hypothetical protein